MTHVKFAIIGYGNIGKRHAAHIRNNSQAELVGICDIDPTKFSDGNKEPTFSSVTDMLAQVDADIINVCSPNFLHKTHTVQALQSGRHVVCEKPMALSTIECDDMIGAAKAANKTIFVVKQNRYNEPVQQVKKLLDNHVLGKLYFVQVNCFWNRNEAYYYENNWRGRKEKDGGCLFTQFSHFVDIMYYLVGSITHAQGMIQNVAHAYTSIEDTGSFVMQTHQGVMVNFNFSTCSYEKNMEGAITLIAEHGTIKIGGQYLNTIEYQHIKNTVLPSLRVTTKPNDYGLYQGSMSNHDKVIQNVIDTLQGNSQAMTSDLEGRQVIEIIETMYGSAQ